MGFGREAVGRGSPGLQPGIPGRKKEGTGGKDRHSVLVDFTFFVSVLVRDPSDQAGPPASFHLAVQSRTIRDQTVCLMMISLMLVSQLIITSGMISPPNNPNPNSEQGDDRLGDDVPWDERLQPLFGIEWSRSGRASYPVHLPPPPNKSASRPKKIDRDGLKLGVRPLTYPCTGW